MEPAQKTIKNEDSDGELGMTISSDGEEEQTNEVPELT